ncbi:MAG: GNAT family N-acetyltransferase [Reyranella sp.]|uniref:GNAT family N-acetyltransferase n=1 Tax=Reyranella sp. TaxID=1929291 RepID=UPI0011FA523E|nr:GNAT family N-acetyltransferase [Reyranella sp.]TAJ35369.1 MAG: GNAT family N-acetyltransferase [Reyranella sp.]
MAIRAAQVGEATKLTALCVRSKAHWGYDAEFMRRSAASLRVSSADIALGRMLVAVDGKDRALGVASVIADGTSADLDLFFIDPPFMGRGVGRALFKAAVQAAYMVDARTLTILADPNAAAFYERMGARFLRNAPSDAIPGRSLPLYEYDITFEAAP